MAGRQVNLRDDEAAAVREIWAELLLPSRLFAIVSDSGWESAKGLPSGW